jgi:hypothetical protein
MFQMIYEPHPALKDLVHNIMIHEMNLDSSHPPLRFSVPRFLNKVCSFM